MLKKIQSFLFENTTTKQTVAKNTIWLSVTNIGGRLIKAAIVIYAARVLGTVGYGVFSYALALAGFFTLFADLGLSSVLVREGAKSTGDERLSVFSVAFVVKVFFTILCIFAILFAAPWFSTLPGTKELLPLMALIVAFDTFREFFSAFIRSMEKMEQETVIFILTNVVITVVGFFFLITSPTPKAFAWAYVTGCAIGAIAALFFVRTYLMKIFSHFSARLIVPMVRSAWPFAITSALGILLTNTDILVISLMRPASEVGIYSAAIRIIQVLYLIPAILQFSTLPLIARLANKENEKFRMAFERTLSLVFLVSIPIVIGGIILGTPIMGVVFGGDFSPGGLAFKILILTILFDYPLAIVSAGIFAYDRQKTLIVAAMIGGVGNILLDVLLIPSFGMAGSAVATLIASIASNWYLWHTMKKLNYFEIFPNIKKIIFTGVLMGLVTLTLFAIHTNTLVNIALSAAVYFFLLYRLHEPVLVEIKKVFLSAGFSPYS